jgi:hypothetical protein
VPASAVHATIAARAPLWSRFLEAVAIAVRESSQAGGSRAKRIVTGERRASSNGQASIRRCAPRATQADMYDMPYFPRFLDGKALAVGAVGRTRTP